MESVMKMVTENPDVIRDLGMEPERFQEIARVLVAGSGSRERIPEMMAKVPQEELETAVSVIKSITNVMAERRPVVYEDPKEASTKASARGKSIMSKYSHLRAALDRHETTLQKRWLKKGRAQRLEIINNAWGKKISATHRPDYQAFRREGTPTPHGATKYRDAYMWPFINEEDLTRPRALLLFLHSRGRTPPREFFRSDLEAMAYGREVNAILVVYVKGYLMPVKGRQNRDPYGQLLHTDDHPDATRWLVTRREVMAGEGLLILESQEKTLDFLLKCTTRILHDISSPLDSPIQAAPPSVVEADPSSSSLAVISAEAPYRAPAAIELSRIETLLASARDAASDHLWALREDPGYFARSIFDAKEHRPEMIKDNRDRDHPLLVSGTEDAIWARSVNSVLTDAHLGHELLAHLHTQVSSLVEMQQQYKGEIDPSKDLPTPYLNALLRFRFYLHKLADISINGLNTAHASAPLRHLYCRNTGNDRVAHNESFRPRPNAHRDEKTTYLNWLLRILVEDHSEKAFFDRGSMSRTVDELQRLMDSEAGMKPLITPYLAAYLSDLSVVGECLRQIETYQPWASTFEHFAGERAAVIKSEYGSTSEPWKRVLKTFKGSENALGRYAIVTDGRFHYPIDKRRTKESVEALQRAEHALDLFWSKFDELLHLNIKSLDGLALKELLETRQLQRTPDWIEPTRSSKSVTVDDIVKPLSEIYFDLEQRTESTQSTTQQSTNTKDKPKTRGAAAPAVKLEPVVVDNNAASSTRVFPVDHKASKVFKTLFHTPSFTGSPGEISWPDFLHAMVSVGFKTEKLYGSVWQFVPIDLNAERGIHFHEPHPSGKIPFRNARRHGRRLHRAYGWTGESFVLAEKK